MNKTVNINLAGTFFHIDEDAFAKLTRYLDAIRRSFSDPNGQDEIIKDIEARISELFSEKINNTSQVITIKELDEVIAVMGQPEDYMVDEEIFDDALPNQKSQTRNQSFHKQLFRDTDNKFIAGVSSGLGHYFSVDVIWIRLAWIAMVLLGFGAPILVYIVLWVLIPEALTTSEKLKMNREPVNISNIEKKIKEELKNASDKIKEVDYDKYKDNAQKGANSFFSTIGKIFAGIFSVFGKFFGILLIILSLSAIIGLIVSLFTAGTFGVIWGGHEVFDYSSIVFSFPFWLIALLVFLMVGIPIFALFILGLKLLITNLKSIGTVAKIILFVLWILSIIGLSILGVKQATEQAYDGDYITENRIPIKANDTLKLQMLSNNRYEYDASRSGSIYLKSDEDGNKIIYSNDIRLIVRSTKDSIAKVFIEYKAEGSSFDNAKQRAEAIDYEYTFNNNTLTLNSYFTTDIANKYREQEVEVVLYLPVGTILIADSNTYSFHSNSSRYNDILRNGDEEKHLLIQKFKTICLDCPKSSSIKYNSEGETWELEVNNDFDEKEEGNHIIIDEDGVNIKITDKDDNVNVKIGNNN